MRAIILDNPNFTNGDSYLKTNVGFMESGVVYTTVQFDLDFTTELTNSNWTAVDYRNLLNAKIVAYALPNFGVPITADQIIWSGDSTVAKSFANPSRSLDTAFQVSTSRDALVAYTVQVVSNLSLSGGQLGSVVLEYADNSGMSTNVVQVSEMGGGNTGTLTIGLNTNDTTKTSLTGLIPAGKYVRLRSVDTTGAPVQTIVRAQEVLL
jgi:hypothetical protein